MKQTGKEVKKIYKDVGNLSILLNVTTLVCKDKGGNIL
jgi:hypothetical protein